MCSYFSSFAIDTHHGTIMITQLYAFGKAEIRIFSNNKSFAQAFSKACGVKGQSPCRASQSAKCLSLKMNNFANGKRKNTSTSAGREALKKFWENFFGTVGNPRRGFPGEKGSYFYIIDGVFRHGGAAQTAPFFCAFLLAGRQCFSENINHG
ncbi:MAG: hypothetical protein PUC33_09080 [Oscillospiraceae bacterium]|nr:hypothetical protein [Oscillospiraceae bacterium]